MPVSHWWCPRTLPQSRNQATANGAKYRLSPTIGLCLDCKAGNDRQVADPIDAYLVGAQRALLGEPSFELQHHAIESKWQWLQRRLFLQACRLCLETTGICTSSAEMREIGLLSTAMSLSFGLKPSPRFAIVDAMPAYPPGSAFRVLVDYSLHRLHPYSTLTKVV